MNTNYRYYTHADVYHNDTNQLCAISVIDVAYHSPCGEDAKISLCAYREVILHDLTLFGISNDKLLLISDFINIVSYGFLTTNSLSNAIQLIKKQAR